MTALTELAHKISAHLKRFEADPQINAPHKEQGIRPYFHAGAMKNGRWVAVVYVSFQGWTNLTRQHAERYLAWLDAGNIGKHSSVAADGARERRE